MELLVSNHSEFYLFYTNDASQDFCSLIAKILGHLKYKCSLVEKDKLKNSNNLHFISVSIFPNITNRKEENKSFKIIKFINYKEEFFEVDFSKSCFLECIFHTLEGLIGKKIMLNDLFSLPQQDRKKQIFMIINKNKISLQFLIKIFSFSFKLNHKHSTKISWVEEEMIEGKNHLFEFFSCCPNLIILTHSFDIDNPHLLLINLNKNEEKLQFFCNLNNELTNFSDLLSVNTNEWKLERNNGTLFTYHDSDTRKNMISLGKFEQFYGFFVCFVSTLFSFKTFLEKEIDFLVAQTKIRNKKIDLIIESQIFLFLPKEEKNFTKLILLISEELPEFQSLFFYLYSLFKKNFVSNKKSDDPIKLFRKMNEKNSTPSILSILSFIEADIKKQGDFNQILVLLQKSFKNIKIKDRINLNFFCSFFFEIFSIQPSFLLLFFQAISNFLNKDIINLQNLNFYFSSPFSFINEIKKNKDNLDFILKINTSNSFLIHKIIDKAKEIVKKSTKEYQLETKKLLSMNFFKFQDNKEAFLNEKSEFFLIQNNNNLRIENSNQKKLEDNSCEISFNNNKENNKKIDFDKNRYINKNNLREKNEETSDSLLIEQLSSNEIKEENKNLYKNSFIDSNNDCDSDFGVDFEWNEKKNDNFELDKPNIKLLKEKKNQSSLIENNNQQDNSLLLKEENNQKLELSLINYNNTFQENLNQKNSTSFSNSQTNTFKKNITNNGFGIEDNLIPNFKETNSIDPLNDCCDLSQLYKKSQQEKEIKNKSIKRKELIQSQNQKEENKNQFQNSFSSSSIVNYPYLSQNKNQEKKIQENSPSFEEIVYRIQELRKKAEKDQIPKLDDNYCFLNFSVNKDNNHLNYSTNERNQTKERNNHKKSVSWSYSRSMRIFSPNSYQDTVILNSPLNNLPLNNNINSKNQLNNTFQIENKKIESQFLNATSHNLSFNSNYIDITPRKFSNKSPQNNLNFEDNDIKRKTENSSQKNSYLSSERKINIEITKKNNNNQEKENLLSPINLSFSSPIETKKDVSSLKQETIKDKIDKDNNYLDQSTTKFSRNDKREISSVEQKSLQLSKSNSSTKNDKNNNNEEISSLSTINLSFDSNFNNNPNQINKEERIYNYNQTLSKNKNNSNFDFPFQDKNEENDLNERSTPCKKIKDEENISFNISPLSQDDNPQNNFENSFNIENQTKTEIFSRNQKISKEKDLQKQDSEESGSSSCLEESESSSYLEESESCSEKSKISEESECSKESKFSFSNSQRTIPPQNNNAKNEEKYPFFFRFENEKKKNHKLIKEKNNKKITIKNSSLENDNVISLLSKNSTNNIACIDKDKIPYKVTPVKSFYKRENSNQQHKGKAGRILLNNLKNTAYNRTKSSENKEIENLDSAEKLKNKNKVVKNEKIIKMNNQNNNNNSSLNQSFDLKKNTQTINLSSSNKINPSLFKEIKGKKVYSANLPPLPPSKKDFPLKFQGNDSSTYNYSSNDNSNNDNRTPSFLSLSSSKSEIAPFSIKRSSSYENLTCKKDTLKIVQSSSLNSTIENKKTRTPFEDLTNKKK